MANPEHLEILKQGVDVWNRWRYENPDIFPQLEKADLSGAQLSGADLSWANFYYAKLNGSNLRKADLTWSDFWHASIIGANLTGANLEYARLDRTKAQGAILVEVNLLRTVLTNADLTDADLSNSNLIFSDLREATLDRTIFSGATFGMIAFGDNDFSTAKGLESIRHAGPSYISIDCIYRSQGNIPEVFLRGAGVAENFITYTASLAGRALDFYSCFISYSSKDQSFAERLYADLQSKGVRCWFAPEDLKIGDKFRQRIDSSIRLHDKLLLILSEHSIASPWVEEEVESALERERRENRLVLFPISLDAAVWDSDRAWTASLRRQRHIGDFSRWKDHDSYSKAFERLLRNLKDEGKAGS